MTTAAGDLNRTKMTATQAVMRNPTLTETDKRKHIQTIQQLARDAGLDDETKIVRMEEVAKAAASGVAGVGAGGVSKAGGDGSNETDASSDTGSSTGSSSDEDPSSVSISAADVNKAKMKATQDIMRNTALNQAEKPGLIRKVQAVAADGSLSNSVKLRRMQNLADGKDEEPQGDDTPNTSDGGGDTDDDGGGDVSDAEVAKAKMKATQDIMRHTTLNQAEKPQLIRRVQAIASDSSLSNAAKVKQMQQLAEGKDAATSSSTSSSPPSSSSSPPKEVSDADVNKAKMEATQKIMRDTTLNQAEKPRMIREVQAICSDGSLDNGAKLDKIQGILDDKGTGGAASSSSSSSPAKADEDAKKSAAPDVGEEKVGEDSDDDDDDDDEPVEDVDLTAFKSEVIQGLIKNKNIPGEEKQAKIRAAHAVVLNRTYDDFEKIRRLRKIKKGKDHVEPIGESVFAPLPEAGAAAAAPEEAPAPTAGHGTADERLRAKMSGGAGGGGAQAGVTTNSTANDRLRAKMQGGAAAAGGGAPGVSVGSTANDRLRGKLVIHLPYQDSFFAPYAFSCAISHRFCFRFSISAQPKCKVVEPPPLLLPHLE